MGEDYLMMAVSHKVNIRNFILLLFFFGVIVLDNGSLSMKFIKLLTFIFALLSFVQTRKFSINEYVAWLATFTVFSALSVLWAYDKQITIEAVMTSALNLACVWSILYMLGEGSLIQSKRIQMVLWSIPIFSIAYFVRLFLTYGADVLTGIRYIEEESTSVHNNLGTYSAISIAIIVNFLNVTKKKSFLLIALLGVNVIVLILSGSRKSILYALVPIATIYLLKRKNPFKVIRNGIFSLGAVAVFYYAIMNNSFFYNSIGHGIETLLEGLVGNATDASTAGRLRIISWGMEQFKSNWLLGVGLEGFKMLHLSVYGNLAIADNNYIELLVDLGLVGFIIYYLFYTKFVVNLFKVLKRKKERSKIAFVLGVICAVLICDYGCCSYKNLFLLSVMGIMWCIYKLERQSVGTSV